VLLAFNNNKTYKASNTMPNSVPENISVRNLTQDDIPSLADLLTAAPDEGTVYQFPDVLEYPENMNQLYIKWLRGGIRDRTTLTRIAVLPRENSVRPMVIGFSRWNRRVIDPKDPKKTVLREWRQRSWGDGMSNFVGLAFAGDQSPWEFSALERCLHMA
jgi:hypothetical protein